MIDVATMLNDPSGRWARAMGNASLYGGAALAIAWAASRTGRLSGRWQCSLWRLAPRSTRPATSSWRMGLAIAAAGMLGLVPWRLTGREVEDESLEPAPIQTAAVESEPISNEQREQAASRLKSKGGTCACSVI